MDELFRRAVLLWFADEGLDDLADEDPATYYALLNAVPSDYLGLARDARVEKGDPWDRDLNDDAESS